MVNKFDVGLRGALFEFLIHHQNKPEGYIQEFYQDRKNLRIVCMTIQQAEYLAKAKFFACDMTFKRVTGSIREIILTTECPHIGKNAILCRVFVNSDSAECYYQTFTSIFRIASRLAKQPIHWKYIHNTGIEAVLVDMCNKQAAGLGRFLCDTDTTHQFGDWRHQLLHVIIICKVYFQRSIKKFDTWPEYGLLVDLPKLSTNEAYQLLATCSSSPKPGLAPWARHKRSKWILGGLNMNLSNMPKTRYRQYPQTTNSCEALHASIHRVTGINLSLREGIMSAESFDRQLFSDLQAYLTSGIRPTSRYSTSTPKRQAQYRASETTPVPKRGPGRPPKTPQPRSNTGSLQTETTLVSTRRPAHPPKTPQPRSNTGSLQTETTLVSTRRPAHPPKTKTSLKPQYSQQSEDLSDDSTGDSQSLSIPSDRPYLRTRRRSFQTPPRVTSTSSRYDSETSNTLQADTSFSVPDLSPIIPTLVPSDDCYYNPTTPTSYTNYHRPH
ncbi:unnamed protein product [Penicillium olsonii]|nr:unnamed protein product [Penicillium olsonii]